MSDLYWVFIEERRWKRIPWFRKTTSFCNECAYDDVRAFVDELRQVPDEGYEFKIRLGVTRGDVIYVIY